MGGRSEHMFVERIFFELSVMGRRYVSIMELSECLEVSERTIKRDLAFIRERLGIDIEYSKEFRGHGYKGNDLKVPKPIGM